MILLKNLLHFLNFKRYCLNKSKQNTKNLNEKTQNIILIEFNSIVDCYLIYLFFINRLAKKENAKIHAFIDLKKKYLLNLFKYILILINPFGKFQFYRAFGVNKLLYFYDYSNISKKNELNKNELFRKIKTKRQFERLKIKNILIGDLLYDSYLKKNLKPTIDLNDIHFQEFVIEEIKKFYFWYDLIDENIKGILVSHSVYTTSIPLRICISKKKECFQVNWQSIHKLSKKFYIAYTEFQFYPKIFSKFSHKAQETNLKLAKKRMKLRLDGKIGVDMPYSTKSAFGKIKKKKILKKNNRFKVLITTHCFFDSPHSYGFNLFPDFYEWLDFLGKMSNITDYDWYVKTHPDYIPGTMEIIKSLIVKYPNLKILPADISHNQIVKEGIGAIFTVYGSVGTEYPILNKMVVNASTNNPHIAYNFNLNPVSIKDYKKVIQKLPKLAKKFSINKKKVYEHYYMKNIHNKKNYFYYNLYKKKNHEQIYSHLNNWVTNSSVHKKFEKDLVDKIDKFIKSNKIYINL